MYSFTKQWTYIIGVYSQASSLDGRKASSFNDRTKTEEYKPDEELITVRYVVNTTIQGSKRSSYHGNIIPEDGDNWRFLEEEISNGPKDDGMKNITNEEVFTDAIQKRDQSLKSIAQNHPDKCLNNCDDRLDINKIPRYTFLQSNFKINESLFSGFKENKTILECDGKIEIHYKHFAILREVTLHLHKWQTTGLIEAGKELYTFKDHGLRTDDAEVLRPVKGLLCMQCHGNHVLNLDNTTLENVLMLKYLTIRRDYHGNKVDNENDHNPAHDYKRQFTVAIQREEYANFYHAMLHMHSIFVMLMVFHQQPVNMTILILDAHPQAEIDEMLETLYGPLIRVTKLKKDVKFQNLVLSLKEGTNLLSKYWINSLPHLEEFRTFVYNQFALNSNHFLMCKKLTITFIWRRDKIWHPRNLKGTVQRKIFNEAELYKSVYDKYSSVCINGLLLESVPMKEQLKFIRKTDILIGMHGAGLTHALFLPKTSGFIELFPQNFRKMFHYYKLFEVIAQRRGLHYLYWENTVSENEMPNYFTRVDPVSFLHVVDSMIQKVCAKNNQYN